jgi:hypothetical protein
MQDSHEVSKDGFPNPNFELVQQIHNKQGKQVECELGELL